MLWTPQQLATAVQIHNAGALELEEQMNDTAPLLNWTVERLAAEDAYRDDASFMRSLTHWQFRAVVQVNGVNFAFMDSLEKDWLNLAGVEVLKVIAHNIGQALVSAILGYRR